jgi:hypothetical protein
VSCSSEEAGKSKLFTLLPASETHVNFSNNITYSETFNPYTFRNFFNGGGVAIGDINNDQLPDLFFCSNQQSNKLYLNKGNWQFEDITESAGLASQGIWSTGVTMADVNGDGWLDIYVCKSGDPNGQHRSNELFINNGPSSADKSTGWAGGFTEKAQAYGLNNRGLSTHAAFFDYDNDGDLDCYLLNNSIRSVGNYDLIKDQRTIPDTAGGNKLYRNDNNRFVDVTAAAGIYSSSVGFGLGISVADINKDGWADIYISNDFFEKDYLYINRQNGRFEESLEKYIRELSLNSMGADIADINNDGYAEVYVTDMLPEEEARLKTKTTFENWDKYRANVQSGYYRQFIRNVLQLNNGPLPAAQAGAEGWGGMSEIGRMAGVAATDWSWGALITDLDNDGFKDIFVANGIYKDITDQDYIQYTANAYTNIRQQIINKEKNIITRLIDLIPSHPIPNYAYGNNGDLTFTNKAATWGLDEPGFSNGAAYGDLDNDGDLDLVVNNVNSSCFIYRNNSAALHPENKFLKVILKGAGKNRFGIGAKVTVHYNHTLAYQEQMPMRGFESTVDNRLNFGLGGASKIDSLVVVWPDGRVNVMKDVQINKTVTVNQQDGVFKVTSYKFPVSGSGEQAITPVTCNLKPVTNPGIDFVHKENEFVDFDRDRLIFHMLSTEGPRMAKGDVNKDGREDIYICGAKDQSGALYVQQVNGRFIKSNAAVFEKDKVSEDTDALFFDADGDGDEDLYVCSGGNEFSPNATALIDRLYMNNGKGDFSKSPQVLPSYIFESTSCVRSADYDQDGDLDLLVGVRLKPFAYGHPCKGYILQNNGKAIFSDVTEQVAPGLKTAGMITDAQWLDYDKDGKTDLVVAGEYMPVKMYHNEGGKLKEVSGVAGLDKSNGWWNRLIVADINQDGYPDLVGGNHGLNSRFKASVQKPVRMYVSDFDGSGMIKHVVSCYNGDSAYPMALRHDLVGVLPYLKKKYLKYESYKGQQAEDIFTAAQLDKAVKLEAYEFCSCVFINNRRGGFVRKPLPTAVQLSPMYGIAVADVDGDGKTDLLMGGNFYQSKPEAGIYDASYGVLLKGDGTGRFTAVPAQQSSIQIKGAVRDIITLKAGKKKLMLYACNDSEVKCYEY